MPVESSYWRQLSKSCWIESLEVVELRWHSYYSISQKIPRFLGNPWTLRRPTTSRTIAIRISIVVLISDCARELALLWSITIAPLRLIRTSLPSQPLQPLQSSQRSSKQDVKLQYFLVYNWKAELIRSVESTTTLLNSSAPWALRPFRYSIQVLSRVRKRTSDTPFNFLFCMYTGFGGSARSNIKPTEHSNFNSIFCSTASTTEQSLNIFVFRMQWESSGQAEVDRNVL